MKSAARTIARLAYGVIATGFENEAIDDLPAFGGYVLFARNGTNIAAVRRITDRLRSRHAGDLPPAIAIDQEGGRVARIREGLDPMPPLMSFGAVNDPGLTIRAAEQAAFDLRRAGVTVSLAPVLDLALEEGNTVIGTRSFGSDPEMVTKLGEAYARGLQAGGMLSCFKHFPGHGSTAVDSHVDLPVIEADAATLRARDLVPFARLAGNAVAVMGGHVRAGAFDTAAPASRSAALIALLRAEFGFSGAYLTDCLEMGAVSREIDTMDAALAALRAGADLLLFSHQPALAQRTADAIVRAVEGGTVPLSRLEEAYERAARLRRAGAPPIDLDAFAPHPGVGREIARRSVTVVRGVAHADPTASYVVSFGGDSNSPSLRKEAPALLEVTLDADAGDEADAIGRVAESGRRPIVLTRRAHLHSQQAAAVRRVVERFPDALIVSMLEPFDVGCFPDARHVLAAYGDDAASIGGLADVAFGARLSEGRLPVRVAQS